MKSLFTRFLSILNIVGLLIQLSAPLLFLSPTPAFASSISLSWDTAANSFKVANPTNYLLAYRTADKTEVVFASKAEVYAGTCSTGGTCVPQTPLRGILKASGNDQIFTINSGSLDVIQTVTALTSDLSAEEIAWLENPTAENLAKISQTTANTIPAPPVNPVLLATNKLDYSPTETVIVSGSGLVPNTAYTLVITSDNLVFTTTVITNINGAFTYNYQLDGTYRPNYKIEVKDASGAVVATTTFTDDAGQIQSAFTVTPSSGITSTNFSGTVTWNDKDTSDNDGKPECSGSHPNNYRFRIVSDGTLDHGDWVPGTGTTLVSENITCANSGNPEGQLNFDGTGGGQKHDGGTITRSFNLTSGTHNVCFVLIDRDHVDESDNITSCQSIDVSVATGPSIVINTINNTQPPFNFTCPSNPLLNPVNISGSGAGSAPPGQIDQYHVQVDWGDGNVDNGLGIFTPSSGQGNFTFTFSDGPHIYTSGGNFTIKVRLYHSQPPGNDNQADAVASVTVCVNVSGNIKIIKNTTGGNGTFGFTITGPSSSTPNITTSGGMGNTGLISVNTGTYSVSETVPAGWSLTNSSCDSGTPGQFTVNSGSTVTCTFSDTKLAILTVKKHVVNDNGGQANAGNFMLHVKSNGSDVSNGSQAGDETGRVYTLSAGTYVVSEDAPPTGYTQTGFSGNCDSQGSITLSAGDNKTCTITNDDIQPKLTVTKVVTNDNGGTKQATDFPLLVNQTSVTSGQQNGFNAGTYAISETQQAGYSGPSFSGNCSPQGQVSLSVGDVKSCTITNDDVAPTLKLVKTVTNDNGGAATASNFQAYVDGNPVAWNQNITLSAGSHSATESALFGYSASSWGGDCATDGTIRLSVGETKTCTIINNDIQPQLTVIKNVVADNGGSAVAGDFTMSVTGNNPSPSSFSGNENGTTVSLNAGAYNVTESGPSGYDSSSSSNCSGSIAVGETKTCTFTNDDKQPKLIVIKHVVTDNGGTAVAGDFNITVSGNSPTPASFSGEESPGTTVFLNVGEYSVSEEGPSGYGASYSSECSGTVSEGQTKTCTITNDDIQPTLTVNKTLVPSNDSGKFNLQIDNNTVGTGANVGDGGTTGAIGVNAGSYIVGETAGTNTILADYTTAIGGDCDANGNVTLILGENKTCTITNTKKGKVIVTKFNDENNDGFDQGEPVLSDWTINFSDNGSQVTNSSGTATFNNVVPGEYTLSENPQSDWYLSNIYCGEEEEIDTGNEHSIYVAAGETVNCYVGNYQKGQITVTKSVVGPNGQDITDASTNFTFNLSGQEPFSLTDNQSRTFNVDPGSYTLSEQEPANYTFEGCTLENIVVSSGQLVTTTCTNKQKQGGITGLKWNDQNGNGRNDEEPGLSGWTIFLDSNNDGKLNNEEPSTTTGQNGGYNFSELNPGIYRVCEVTKPGWLQTYPINNELNNCHSVPVGSNQTVTSRDFGNQQQNPILTLTKSNNAVGDKSPGSDIQFTLTLTATQSAATNVWVTDLPAGGFKYRGGSWSAMKNGLPFVIPEPVYASPGKWSLGDMNVGDEVVLTYTADINNSQHPGLYKDLAWAQGQSLAATAVLGNESTGIFVGTQVNVIHEQQSVTGINVETIEQRGEVLGASTLPATGGKTLWVVMALLTGAIGSGLAVLGIYLLRKSRKFPLKILGVLVVLVLAGSFMVKPQGALAVANLSVRLEEPKSPTRIDTFNLNFVALDIQNRAVTVQCWKKAPGDADYLVFTSLTTTSGGNTGNCLVNSSIVSANGSYLFKVTATADAETVESPIVSVDFNLNGPGTPTNYTKEQINSCRYKISFRTADDGGKTVRVELYRSTDKSFDLNSGTRVDSQNIGSNTNGSFTNDVPDCGKTYYYAIRAYDSADNGSGAIGDSFVTVVTTATTAAPTVAPAGGAIPVSGVTLPAGPTVLGEGSPAGVLGEATPAAEVVKLSTSQESLLPKGLLLIGLLAILGIILYVFKRRQKE